MSSEMAKASTEKTMSWLSASKAATDAVYYGIQSGKSNSEALIDGIVKGTVGILTDKISPGTILNTMLGDKKGWQGMLRTFLSEGTEEVTEVWAERIFDIVSEQDESEVRQTYRGYIEHGATPAEALLRLCGKYAMEDSEAFFVAGVTGVAIEKASNLFSSKGKQYDKAEPGDIESEAEFDKAFEKGYNEDDDLLELEKLRNSLGQNAPQSIKEYQDLKYGDQWGAYQAYANAIESGNLSPMADFGLYQSKSAEIDKVLIGVQAANGTTITGKSKTFVAETIGSVSNRQGGVNVQAILYAITHPTAISSIKTVANGRTQRLVSKRVWVLIDIDAGTIIQVGTVVNNNWRDALR